MQRIMSEEDGLGETIFMNFELSLIAAVIVCGTSIWALFKSRSKKIAWYIKVLFGLSLSFGLLLASWRICAELRPDSSITIVFTFLFICVAYSFSMWLWYVALRGVREKRVACPNQFAKFSLVAWPFLCTGVYLVFFYAAIA